MTRDTLTLTESPRPDSPPARRLSPPWLGERPERLVVLAFIVFLATLPLEWLTLSKAGGGLIKPFHVSALVFIVVCLVRWRPAQLLRGVAHRHVAVYGSYLVLLGATLAAGLAYADPYLSRDTIGRQFFYGAASLVVAGMLALVIGRRPQRGIAWTGVITCLTLVGAIGVASATQHVDPIGVVRDALVQQNPDLITYRLLRSAFRSDPELGDVGANLRHKVFLGLLLAAFAGLAYTMIVDRRRRLTRGVLVGGSVVAFGFVILSLSRSTILCLVITLMLFPLRIVVRKRASASHAASVAVAAALTLAVALSPVGELLYTRFMTSASYDSRITGAGSSFLAQFEDAALAGTQQSKVLQSPHNLVLNSWLAGGIIAAAAAVVLLVAFARVWAREVRRYITGGRGWVLPVEQLWIIGIGVIPLVRSVTAGNQFHMVEWVAVGVFLGTTFANERAAARAVVPEPQDVLAVPNGRLVHPAFGRAEAGFSVGVDGDVPANGNGHGRRRSAPR
jgi:hypothetical protein